MTSETTRALFEVARLIGAGVVGGLIATFAGHLLTVSREQQSERRHRKREFRSFIVQFRSEATDRQHPPNTFTTFYRDKLPNLRHAVDNIADDIPPKRRAEFDRLVNTAAGFTDDDLLAYNGKTRVDAALDAIRQFIDR